jgi:hypothetical protein
MEKVMQWYEVTADRQLYYQRFLTEDSDAHVRENILNWADRNLPGQRGYTFTWKKIDCPPEEWLQDQIDRRQEKIDQLRFEMDEYESLIPKTKW